MGKLSAAIELSCISVTLSAALAGQPVSRFNGTWVRDAAVSDPVGGRIGGPGRPVDGVTLVIDDRDVSFQVTRRVSLGPGGPPELVQRFRLDGQESVNLAPAPGGVRGEARSTARRDGARIIVESVQWITAVIDVKTTDIYQLSEDGKTLTVHTTRTNRMGTQTGNQTYRRK